MNCQKECKVILENKQTTKFDEIEDKMDCFKRIFVKQRKKKIKYVYSNSN